MWMTCSPELALLAQPCPHGITCLRICDYQLEAMLQFMARNSRFAGLTIKFEAARNVSLFLRNLLDTRVQDTHG